MEFAGYSGMQTPPLTRPPRTRRPPEVARHVGALLDAYRRVQAGRKRGKRRPQAPAGRRTTA